MIFANATFIYWNLACEIFTDMDETSRMELANILAPLFLRVASLIYETTGRGT